MLRESSDWREVQAGKLEPHVAAKEFAGGQNQHTREGPRVRTKGNRDPLLSPVLHMSHFCPMGCLEICNCLISA